MAKRKEQADQAKCEEFYCPFFAFGKAMQDRKGRHPDFFDHMKKAELEVLQAFRSLLDERIKQCKDQPPKKKKATKIKVR